MSSCHPSRLFAVVLAAALFWTPELGAQEIPPVEYYTNSPLMVGNDVPILTVACSERLEDVTITLRRGRSRSEHTFARIQRGQ